MKNLFGTTTTVPTDVVSELPDMSDSNEVESNVVDEKPSQEAQGGVQKAEAVTLLWTKKNLLLAYFFVFLVFFTISLEQQIQNNLVYYVYSAFKLSPIVSTAGIVSQIAVGVFKLPLARIIDIIGRAEGLALMTLIATIGLIMMAACKNAETYAAAYVFYWVGFDGIAYVLNVFVADTSSLKNRAFVVAITTTPYIVTTFIGPPAAQSFIETSGWRWGYGSFTIITPFIVIPIMYVIWSNQRKALTEGLIVKSKSGRSLLQSVNYYFWEFDAIGILLILAGVSLILLPFSLAAYQTKGWASGMVIAMLVLGILCLLFFPLWEKFLAKKCFIPFALLSDRTIMGACLLAAFLNISFYMWDTYFYYYLQVVHDLSITNTGYMTNIYSIGSCFWGVVVGFAIRKSGYFKWIALVSVPLEMLGVGLMIHFRQPDQNIGYVVMCQIFIAFGGGALVLCEEMAVMAAVSHQNIASILAFISLFSSVGAAIGLAVASVIYAHTFPQALAEALPGNSTLNAELYASTTTQLLYAVGTPERTAVIAAYGHSQRILCIAGVAWLIPCLGFVAIWRNYKVSEMTQVKGRVV